MSKKKVLKMLAYTYIHKNFFWDKCCQYVFFSINHYYPENQGLKRTENKRSVQFKFTKKLNFLSFQSSFGKSELSSVQSLPKKELLNWTELFRSVRPIHWVYIYITSVCFIDIVNLWVLIGRSICAKCESSLEFDLQLNIWSQKQLLGTSNLLMVKGIIWNNFNILAKKTLTIWKQNKE